MVRIRFYRQKKKNRLPLKTKLMAEMDTWIDEMTKTRLFIRRLVKDVSVVLVGTQHRSNAKLIKKNICQYFGRISMIIYCSILKSIRILILLVTTFRLLVRLAIILNIFWSILTTIFILVILVSTFQLTFEIRN